MSDERDQRCERLRAELSEYLDGGLASDARVALEEHLARCVSCRQFCETLRETIDLCRGAPDPPANRECLRRATARAREELARRGLL